MSPRCSSLNVYAPLLHLPWHPNGWLLPLHPCFCFRSCGRPARAGFPGLLLTCAPGGAPCLWVCWDHLPPFLLSFLQAFGREWWDGVLPTYLFTTKPQSTNTIWWLWGGLLCGCLAAWSFSVVAWWQFNLPSSFVFSTCLPRALASAFFSCFQVFVSDFILLIFPFAVLCNWLGAIYAGATSFAEILRFCSSSLQRARMRRLWTSPWFSLCYNLCFLRTCWYWISQALLDIIPLRRLFHVQVHVHPLFVVMV